MNLQQFYLQSKSPAFQRVLEQAARVADSSANILLTGESGVGKEVVARYIHSLSQRSERPFVAVNCSSYSDTLLNSELFGHEQGAFTGALKSREGKFEAANHGTLFLDEIGDIDETTQVKLLRAIETKIIERIGGNELRKIDFRLISATNRNMHEAVCQGRFREDFFYRISTIVINIPSLRERREDYQDFVRFFIENAERENSRKITDIRPEVQQFFDEYEYPGNIRELKNIIDRMVVLSREGVIDGECLPVLFDMRREQSRPSGNGGGYRQILPLREFHERTERDYLAWVLEQSGGNASAAARQLQLSPRQMYNKIRQYGLRSNREEQPAESM